MGHGGDNNHALSFMLCRLNFLIGKAETLMGWMTRAEQLFHFHHTPEALEGGYLLLILMWMQYSGMIGLNLFIHFLLRLNLLQVSTFVLDLHYMKTLTHKWQCQS